MSLPGVGEWSKPCPGLDLEGESAYIFDRPSIFTEDALYFIVAYDDDEDDNEDDDDEDDDEDDDDDDDEDDDNDDDYYDDEDDYDGDDDDDNNNDNDDDDDDYGDGDEDDDDDDDDHDHGVGDNEDGNYITILKYDLGSNCLSMIDPPSQETHRADDAILISMEDGSLGLAHLDGLTLNIWSRQMGPDTVSTWTRQKVVNLKELFPNQNIKKTLQLTGSVEGSDIIFVTMDLGIYEINLKSLQWKKTWKKEEWRSLFPYMSFYNP
jgi:hypothetical protein